MPENLAGVWTDVSSFFSTALTSAVSLVTTQPLLVAPVVVGVAGIVIGSAKRLLKTGGRRNNP